MNKALTVPSARRGDPVPEPAATSKPRVVAVPIVRFVVEQMTKAVAIADSLSRGTPVCGARSDAVRGSRCDLAAFMPRIGSCSPLLVLPDRGHRDTEVVGLEP